MPPVLPDDLDAGAAGAVPGHRGEHGGPSEHEPADAGRLRVAHVPLGHRPLLDPALRSRRPRTTSRRRCDSGRHGDLLGEAEAQLARPQPGPVVRVVREADHLGDEPGEVLVVAHADPAGAAAADVLEALDATAADAAAPQVLASKVVTMLDPQHAFLVNRNRIGSMALPGESLFVLEMQPASYAILATNEAEKAADIKVVDYRMIGATGRVYLSGREADVRQAAEAAEQALGVGAGWRR